MINIKATWNIEKVIMFVRENSECELLSKSYKNNKEKLLFKCKCGDVFSTPLDKFINRNKRRCNACSYEQIRVDNLFTYDEVKSYVKENSSCTLLTDKYVDSENPIDFLCECGTPFSIPFRTFKQRKSKTCLRCSSYTSNGENVIEDILRANDISFKKQLKFDDLRSDNDKHRLSFDFAIYVNNILELLIEFDGKQHFTPIEYFGGEKSFSQLKKNDERKESYCVKYGIPLLRIPYFKVDSIKEILIENKVISHHVAC